MKNERETKKEEIKEKFCINGKKFSFRFHSVIQIFINFIFQNVPIFIFMKTSHVEIHNFVQIKILLEQNGK